MGFFDGMENQVEIEICFKKLVNAFLSLAEDLIEEEKRERARQAELEETEKVVAEILGPDEESQTMCFAQPAATDFKAL